MRLYLIQDRWQSCESFITFFWRWGNFIQTLVEPNSILIEI